MIRPLPNANDAPRQRVALIQPPIGGGPGDVAPPVGLLVLAAILEREGHEVSLVDFNLMQKQGRFSKERSLRNQYRKELPPKGEVDVFGITTWSYAFDLTMELVEEIRKRYKHVPIVLGGPHVTFVDEEVLSTFASVTCILRDEGDHTFPRLLEALAIEDPSARDEALSQVAGLSWRRGAEIVRNPAGGVVEDLDALPYPAYHLVDVKDYLERNPVLMLEAGRGCPYNCNFCSTTNMFSRKYRVKSAARLVDEVEWAMKACESNRFELLHDNLVANRSYVSELCAEIRRRNLDVDWSCTSRTDNITEEIAQEMFVAGCSQVFFGVESLSAERQKWTGKKLSPPKVHAAIELTARQHLIPTVGIIVGFPDESPEELDVTVRAAVRWATEPDIAADVSTAMLRYYPGADLFSGADELRYDELAAAYGSAAPGHRMRAAWQKHPRIFPLSAIHTPPDETRRNLTRALFARAFLSYAPTTFRACLERLDLRAGELLDQIAAHADEGFLDDAEDRDRLTNSLALGLGRLIAKQGDEALVEILAFELPFWERGAVVGALNELEHVQHPKRFVHAALLDYARGVREELPQRLVRPHVILGVRAGRETFTSITEEPEAVLATFQRQLAPLLAAQRDTPVGS